MFPRRISSWAAGAVLSLSIVVFLPVFRHVEAQNSGASLRARILESPRAQILGRAGAFLNPHEAPFGRARRGAVSGGDPVRPGVGPIFFNPANFPSGGVLASSVSTGDFNGDGKADLVVANQCLNGNCNSGGVAVLLGNGDGTFEAARSFASGGYEAYAVAVGDVNGDGKADLVVAHGCQSATQCTSGVVGVLLGNGDGTFQTAQVYASGGLVASAVAIADLHGNGKADLVVANQCSDASCVSGGIGVLLGNGKGKFQNAHSYTSGGVTAVSVAAADLNGDRKLDVVVTNQCQNGGSCSGNVGVLLGNGDGTFRPAQSYASGGYRAVAATIADVNGDTKADILIADQCKSSTDCTAGNVGVLLGNGDGTFQSARTYVSGGNNTAGIVAADLDGDGRTDLALANQCQILGDCNDGNLSILLGNGDGTFQPPQNYLADGVFALSVVAGDWNGDGKMDLAVADQCQNGSNCSGVVTALMGNGDGTFQAPPGYSSGGYNADSVATGDLDRDGKLDLVVSNACDNSRCATGNGGNVRVLLGNGDGTFRLGQKYSSGGYGTSSVAMGDLNGNGKLDVIVANQCATSDCKSGGSVSILMGNGDGTLQAAQSYPTRAFTAEAIVLADVNNDGKLDVIVASLCQTASCQNGAVSVLLGNGNGTLQAAQTQASGGLGTNALAVGDFNRDGILDVVTASQCLDSSCTRGGVGVLLGNGDGTFQIPQSYNSGGAQADSVVVADLNADGKLDLVVSNLCQTPGNCANGTVGSLPGKGDGTFWGARSFSSGGQNASAVVAGDFNGDGNQDVVVANSDVTCVLLGNGDANFQTAVPYYPGGISLAVGDFNGDQQPDLAIGTGTLSAATILPNVVVGYRQATATTLASVPNPSSVNQSVAFTATVTTQAHGSPTGTVTFQSGTTGLGQVTLVKGQANLNYAFTMHGTNTITAMYSGDSTFLPSTSGALRQKVTPANTTTTITSLPNPSNFGQSVTFTINVAGQYGGTPTGMVTLKDGQTVLTQVSLKGGGARYKTAALAKGKHHIVANYSGDANFRFSQGIVVQTVQ